MDQAAVLTLFCGMPGCRRHARHRLTFRDVLLGDQCCEHADVAMHDLGRRADDLLEGLAGFARWSADHDRQCGALHGPAHTPWRRAGL